MSVETSRGVAPGVLEPTRRRSCFLRRSGIALFACLVAGCVTSGVDEYPLPPSTDVFVPSVWSAETATGTMVSSVAALQAAIDAALPGQTIVLADGTYRDGTLLLGASGITVQSQTPGGVRLDGAQHVVVTGNRNVLRGFQFASGDIGDDTVIDVTGSDNTLTQLSFDGYRARRYLHFAAGSHGNELSFSNISRKSAEPIGPAIQINTSPAVAGYHRIRYCAFRDFPGPGGDHGNEPIRIGLGEERANPSRTLVEHCYFSRVGTGDSESVSVKSSENMCRYNTFTDNPGGMLVFRAGNRNVAYGNFFLAGAGGVRTKEGHGHDVVNNYFETGAADALRVEYVSSDPAADIRVVHNTFVNMGVIDLGGQGPVGMLFANNLFDKPGALIFSNDNGKTSFVGNLSRGILGMTIPSGMTSIDPMLERSEDGYLVPAAKSPALDGANEQVPDLLRVDGIEGDPAVNLDISGQPRPEVKSQRDVGCSERQLTPGAPRLRPLDLRRVGPVYLGGPPIAK